MNHIPYKGGSSPTQALLAGEVPVLFSSAATAALLKVGSLGNVRTETLRAFSADEMKGIIAKMP